MTNTTHDILNTLTVLRAENRLKEHIVKKYYKQIMQFIGEGWVVNRIVDWINKRK